VFGAVCDKLGLAFCDHKAAQTVTKIMIELEQRGVREPAMLREMTLTLFSQRREIVHGVAPPQGIEWARPSRKRTNRAAPNLSLANL
jgi:hypothetical protein